MSLYSLEEVCHGCCYARWMRGNRRVAFDFCELDVEKDVDHVRGRCESWAAEEQSLPASPERTEAP